MRLTKANADSVFGWVVGSCVGESALAWGSLPSAGPFNAAAPVDDSPQAAIITSAGGNNNAIAQYFMRYCGLRKDRNIVLIVTKRSGTVFITHLFKAVGIFQSARG